MKPSIKRRRQLQKIKDNRHKGIIVNGQSKPPLVQQKDSFFVSMVKKIIKRKRVEFICKHVLVGSSQVLRFLRKQYTIYKSHGFLRSGLNNKIGSIGEQAFTATNSGYVHQPFAISKQLPFICTTPDFIMNKPNLKVVEIKTCTRQTVCKSLFDDLPSEYILQVWIAMEIFGIKSGQLNIYYFESTAKRVNKYACNKFVSLYGIIYFENQFDSMLDHIKDSAINSYCEFLEHFCKYFRKRFSKKDTEDAVHLFNKCYAEHKSLKISNKNFRNLIVNQLEDDVERFARKLLGLTLMKRIMVHIQKENLIKNVIKILNKT